MITFEFKIGMQYWGATDPFAIVTVDASNVQEALTIAANYLRPNHLQTLVVVGQPR